MATTFRERLLRFRGKGTLAVQLVVPRASLLATKTRTVLAEAFPETVTCFDLAPT
jgi:hypothetical protein